MQQDIDDLTKANYMLENQIAELKKMSELLYKNLKE